MKSRLSLVLLLLSVTGYGQEVEFVRSEVEILADSSFSGRGYVRDGAEMAAKYLESRFEELGVSPGAQGYLQPFSFRVNTFPTTTILAVDGDTLDAGFDYLIDPRSGSSIGVYSISHVDSAHFYSGASTVEHAKKTVPVIDTEWIDTSDEREVLEDFLSENLSRRPVILLKSTKLMWTVGRSNFEETLIEVKLSEFPMETEQVRIDIRSSEKSVAAYNVIGKVEGRRSDSIIVFSAHYDHLGMMGDAIFRGASDNATGTAMLLDLADHYTHERPEFDTYFIAFSAEEAGLLGSSYFVTHPTFDLESVKMVINLDLLGSAAKGITVVNGKSFPEAMDKLKNINDRMDLLPRIKLRTNAANSDHYPFTQVGVPAIFIYTEGNITAYHDVYDVPGVVDWVNYPEVFTLLVQFVETL